MSSDALQSFLVIVALIGVMLFVRFIAGTKARARRASAAQPPRVLPARAAAGPLPMPPPPVLGAPVTPSAPMALTPQRRRRRVNLADARTGIVLATILGACRAHRADEPW